MKNFKKPYTAPLLLLIAFGLLSCVVNSNKKKSKELIGDKFIHYDLNYSLQFPLGWTHKIDERIGQVHLDAISRNKVENNFSANVVAINTLRGGIPTVTEFLSAYKDQLKTRLVNPVFHSETSYVHKEVAVANLVYSGTSGNIKVKTLELIFINRDKIIQIACTDLTSSFDNRTEFSEVKNSLDFQNP